MQRESQVGQVKRTCRGLKVIQLSDAETQAVQPAPCAAEKVPGGVHDLAYAC